MTDYTLHRGGHDPSDGRRCAMEWVAYLAGETHSDAPACVDTTVAVCCRQINDALGHKDRQKLRPYLARTIGTQGDGNEAERDKVYVSLELAHCRTPGVCIACVLFALRSRDVDFALHFLDRLLPTVPVQLPVAEDAAAVCAVQA